MPTTIATFKCFSRPQSYMQALMADLARVSRIDSNYLNSSLNSFVLKKLSKLVERPRVRPSALCFVSRLLISSLSNTCQILNSNYCAYGFGLINNGSTDVVVYPCLVSTLSSRHPFQKPFGSFCAFRLKRRSHTRKPVPNFCYSTSIPFISLRSTSNVSTSPTHLEQVRGGMRASPKSTPTTLLDLIISGVSSLN